MQHQGHIVSWKAEKNFGFIRANGVSGDVFLHASDIRERGYTPKPGDEVKFLLIDGSAGKPKAREATFPTAGPALLARRAYLSSLILLQIVLWSGVLVATFFLARRLFAPLSIYMVMSGAAYLIYYFDKRQAIRRAQRVPELVLHVIALFGGWPGAFLAQGILRHKTSKHSFQIVFWGIVLVHIFSWIYVFAESATQAGIL